MITRATAHRIPGLFWSRQELIVLALTNRFIPSHLSIRSDPRYFANTPPCYRTYFTMPTLGPMRGENLYPSSNKLTDQKHDDPTTWDVEIKSGLRAPGTCDHLAIRTTLLYLSCIYLRCKSWNRSSLISSVTPGIISTHRTVLFSRMSDKKHNHLVVKQALDWDLCIRLNIQIFRISLVEPKPGTVRKCRRASERYT